MTFGGSVGNIAWMALEQDGSVGGWVEKEVDYSIAQCSVRGGEFYWVLVRPTDSPTLDSQTRYLRLRLARRLHSGP
jgi:hypothetical protein